MTLRESFKRGNAEEWTVARIAELSVQEIKQLRDNAERLNEPSLVERCRTALQHARSHRAPQTQSKPYPPIMALLLISRVNAFDARGVSLQDTRSSWSGVRQADGKDLVALWAD